MDDSPKRILVIEDEEEILINLSYLLEAEGFQPILASDGPTGVNLAKQHLPDLIISDIMMPGMNGYKVIETLRGNPATRTIPFIFLTARAEKASLRQGMELGADDYLTKPFTREELLRAIETRLQRQLELKEAILKPVTQELHNAASSINQLLKSIEDGNMVLAQAPSAILEHADVRTKQPASSITVHGLTINFETHTVTVEGQPVKLSYREYQLLVFLIENAGRVVNYKAMLSQVWGPEYELETHYLHVYVSQLRQKIEPDPANPRYIFTEKGFGYRFVKIPQA